MHRKNLAIYFDFLSPFSYFLSHRFNKLENIEIHWKPVVLAKLLNHWEIKAPAEVAPKREYLFRQSLRFASKNNLPFSPPIVHPFNPLYALRLACLETHQGDEEQQKKTIFCLWKNIWGEGKNPDNPDSLIIWLNEEGLPGNLLLENSYNKSVKEQLKLNTNEAIEHRIFGVPSTIAKNGITQDMFWGNDAFDDIMEFLANKDVLDRTAYNRMVENTQMGASARLQI
jgi:2-hydroxychromene-2-carboxylate isomerase